MKTKSHFALLLFLAVLNWGSIQDLLSSAFHRLWNKAAESTDAGPRMDPEG